MTAHATILGIWFATPLLLAYLLCHIKKRQTPDFSQCVAVFMATLGAVVGVFFGIDTLKASSPCASVCEDQRVPMYLGALAIEFVSLWQLVQSFYRLLR